MNTSSSPPKEPPRSLLSLRAALILVIAVLCGLATAWLTYDQRRSLAEATLAGMAAFAAAAISANQLIGDVS